MRIMIDFERLSVSHNNQQIEKFAKLRQDSGWKPGPVEYQSEFHFKFGRWPYKIVHVILFD